MKAVISVLLALIIVFASVHKEDNFLKIVFIDVENALSIYIKTPKGKNFLIDSGVGLRNTHSVLRGNKVKKFEAMINTNNYTGDFEKLLKIYKTKAFYTVDKDKWEIPVEPISENTVFSDGDVKIESLSDSPAGILVTYKENKFFFGSTMSKYQQNSLVVDGIIDEAQVVSGVKSRFFLENVKPRYAVIDPQDKSTYEKLWIEYFTTETDGNITFMSDGYEISTLYHKN